MMWNQAGDARREVWNWGKERTEEVGNHTEIGLVGEEKKRGLKETGGVGGRECRPQWTRSVKCHVHLGVRLYRMTCMFIYLQACMYQLLEIIALAFHRTREDNTRLPPNPARITRPDSHFLLYCDGHLHSFLPFPNLCVHFCLSTELYPFLSVLFHIIYTNRFWHKSNRIIISPKQFWSVWTGFWQATSACLLWNDHSNKTITVVFLFF